MAASSTYLRKQLIEEGVNVFRATKALTHNLVSSRTTTTKLID